jgi:hypothetical protein
VLESASTGAANLAQFPDQQLDAPLQGPGLRAFAQAALGACTVCESQGTPPTARAIGAPWVSTPALGGIPQSRARECELRMRRAQATSRRSFPLLESPPRASLGSPADWAEARRSVEWKPNWPRIC